MWKMGKSLHKKAMAGRGINVKMGCPALDTKKNFIRIFFLDWPITEKRQGLDTYVSEKAPENSG